MIRGRSTAPEDATMDGHEYDDETAAAPDLPLARRVNAAGFPAAPPPGTLRVGTPVATPRPDGTFELSYRFEHRAEGWPEPDGAQGG
jgi:hypothetical protein